MQRETAVRLRAVSRQTNFNPLPLYRGRQLAMASGSMSLNISILSLYTEGDGMLSSINSNFTGFQSSPSIQRETTKGAYADDFYVISILSLYTEGDQRLSAYIQG